MAAPSSSSIHNLNGIWFLNKALSGNIYELLRLQGVSWFLRRAIILMNISLHTFQKVENGVTIIIIQNITPGGNRGTTETRVTDGEPREHSDYIWGHLRGKCSFISSKDTYDELKNNWSVETRNGECLMDEISAVDGAWSSVTLWGFEIIDGVRYLVRHVTVKREHESLSTKMVYGYGGPTP